MLSPILIADDSEDDIFILKRTLNAAAIENAIISVPNGEELVDYLKGKGKFFDRNEFPLPGLIFLDLKMPKMDGFQVLDWLYQNPEFKEIPVVVLTGSMALSEANKAYKLGALSFISKPFRLNDFKALPSLASESLQFSTPLV